MTPKKDTSPGENGRSAVKTTDNSKTPQLSRYLSRAHRAARFVAQRVLLRQVGTALLTIETRGVEQLETPENQELLKNGFVLVSNHTSHLDAVLIITRLPWAVSKDLAFGAAADYFYKVPWRRWLTGLFFNTFPVDREGTGTARGMAFRLVDNGVPVALFPEGTRSRDGKLKKFSPGAALIARRERVPCVPVAVRGAHRAMPAGKATLPKFGRPPVELIVGAPVVPQRGERIQTFAARVEDAVRHMVETGEPTVN